MGGTPLAYDWRGVSVGGPGCVIHDVDTWTTSSSEALEEYGEQFAAICQCAV